MISSCSLGAGTGDQHEGLATGRAAGGIIKKVDVAIFGARMHYAIPRILARAGLLGVLYTDVYLGNKPGLRRLLAWPPARRLPLVVRRLLGREASELRSERVVSFDALGLKTAWSMRRIRSRTELKRLYAKTSRVFCDMVVSAGFSGAGAVYALNGAALEIFRQAKRQGMLCVLEQTIAPARVEDRLLAEEAERWPGAQTEPAGDRYVDNPLAVREEAEWRLADCIVCGSEFVSAGLESLGVERSKCRVVPYGVDASAFRPRDGRGSSRDLNVLFVGTVGLRKGVPYLLEALRRLGSGRLRCRLVGGVEGNQRWLAEHLGSAEAIGPIPRSEIMSMYDWADVFVLPSICEGSATVIYEALACGLPVITTPNAGSVVRDGTDGFVVPIRDPDAIATRLQQLLDDRGLLRIMSKNASKRRREVGLERYAAQFIRVINSLIDTKMNGNEAECFSGGD